MRKFLSVISRFALGAVLVGFFGTGLFFRCANPMVPQGGPVDSLPPRVIEMTPPNGTVDFDQTRIFIEFDEYIQLKDQQKEFFVSPQMQTQPLLTVRGRGVRIDLKDSLHANTTYALNFGSSIADNNEGNALHGFRYVFSTGGEIDSLLMSGYTVDAYSKDSIGRTFIFFYDTTIDTAVRISPAYDSTLIKMPPQVVGRSMPNGIFVTENLKPVPYRVYAFEDNNGNQTYDPSVDRVAFIDSTFNPAHMPPFDLWYDTLRKYAIGDPQLYFRLFMDVTFKRQYLSGSSRPLQHQAVLYFGAPEPEIKRLVFEGIDSSRVVTEYLSPGRDSIAYWFNVPSGELPDTIRGQITFMRHDSINELYEATQELSLSWRHVDTRSRRERRDEEKAIEEDSTAIENPFKYRIEAQAQLNPQKNIPITFDYPLVEVDTARIRLIRREDDRMFRVRFGFEPDSVQIRRWTLTAPWIVGQEYELTIPAGALRNVAGETNDTIQGKYTILSPDKFATLVIGVTGKTPESEYVLQVLNASGKVVDEIRNARTGSHTFQYVEPGTVRLRVVEDDNRNGKWDVGNLVERIQPERVEIYVPPAGNEEIATRENWELSFDIDMNTLFAPIGMESVMREIQRKEALRLQRILENRAKMEKERKNNPQQQQQQSTPYQGGGMENIRNTLGR